MTDTSAGNDLCREPRRRHALNDVIQLTCTSCRTALTVDDAFAGGVCRCSRCGTIQTVPAAASDPRPAAPKPKALYRKPAQPPPGSGLDELARVVASSGLTARTTATPPTAPAATPARPPPAAAAHPPTPARPVRPWVIPSAAAAVVLAMAAVVVLRSVLSSPSTPAPSASGFAGPPAASAAHHPTDPSGDASLAGIDLSRHRAIGILLDRGSASGPVLSPLRVLIVRSLSRLTPDHRFALACWSVGGRDLRYPERGLAYAVEEALGGTRSLLAQVVAMGQSDALGPLQQLLSEPVDAVVIITAKGFELDEPWADRVRPLLARAARPNVTVHALSVGSLPESPGLKRLAADTGGTYVELHPDVLRELGSE